MKKRKAAAEPAAPTSSGAEQTLLACMIAHPAVVISRVEQAVGDREVWQDVRHVAIYHALLRMHSAAIAIDLRSLCQELANAKTLSDAGGVKYIGVIAEIVVSPDNFGYWLQEVVEKWAGRQLVAECERTIEQINQRGADVRSLIEGQVEKLDRLSEASRASTDRPTRIVSVLQFADEIFGLFQGKKGDEPGIELPFGWVWKVRRGELTLAIGEKGKGKSTMLSWILLHMLRHGERGFIASMETRMEASLYILAQQLVGFGKAAPQNDQEAVLVRDALSWLDARVRGYNFLGAVDYRELLQAMDFAAEKDGCTFFLVDSLMRLGIADDDYAGQGRAALALANFAARRNVHVVLVNHLNKSDGETRSRNRGSQQIVDNSHNVISIHRNEKKFEQLEALRAQVQAQEIKEEDYQRKRKEKSEEWDAKIYLHNQRWPGSRQNGVKALWFLPECLQFTDTPNGDPINLLERWRRHPLRKEKHGA